jgi:GTPase
MTEETRAGHVAIIGLPNAGKSSLLNRFVESKLSIVTAAAQTTRERVVGIDSRPGSQLIFLDTPGIVEPAYLLHHAMVGIIERAIEDADVVVLLLDGTRPPPALESTLMDALDRLGIALLVAVNKVDVATPEQLESNIVWVTERFGAEVLPVSAETGTGVEELRRNIVERLPVSPFLYPEDDISAQPVRFFVAELIRESVFELYGDEIPYSVAARVEEFREDADPVFIRAAIFVERPSQKGILIGKKGQAIRELGTRSRAKIEAFLGERVYLDLWVKVLPKWRKDPVHLGRFGFPVPQPEKRNA